MLALKNTVLAPVTGYVEWIRVGLMCISIIYFAAVPYAFFPTSRNIARRMDEPGRFYSVLKDFTGLAMAAFMD